MHESYRNSMSHSVLIQCRKKGTFVTWNIRRRISKIVAAQLRSLVRYPIKPKSATCFTPRQPSVVLALKTEDNSTVIRGVARKLYLLCNKIAQLIRSYSLIYDVIELVNKNTHSLYRHANEPVGDRHRIRTW